MNAIPAVCQPLQTDLDNAKDELAGFVFPVGGSDEDKAAATREKGRLQSEVSRLEKLLQDCIKNPPAPKPDPPPPPPKPDLDVRLEVVQCIQRQDNSVLLFAGKSTVVRAFVSSGVTSGHDAGAGPNRWPNVTGRLTVTDLISGNDIASNLPPFNAGATITAQPTPDRNDVTHSLNFRLPLSVVGRLLPMRIKVQAFVKGHETGPAGFTTSSEVVVVFLPRPPQRVQPILVSDGLAGVPAPPISTFTTVLLTGVLPRYPLSTFIVSSPVTFTTFTPLTTLPGWWLLLGRIAALAAIAPQV